MARGWRKYEYNRQLFGKQVEQHRLSAGWSLGYVAHMSGINQGTLQQVEQGDRSLPPERRSKLIAVLTQYGEGTTRDVERDDFFKAAGLAGASTTHVAHATLGEGETVPSRQDVAPALSHAEHAERLSQQGKWHQAAPFWLLAAKEAERKSQWTTWAKYTSQAGLAALNLSQLEIAESRLQLILSRPEEQIGTEAVARAYCELGWVYYNQNDYPRAKHFLGKSLSLLTDQYLLSAPLHFLGRVYCDWGIEKNNRTFRRRGRALLQKAFAYQYDFPQAMAFSLLRQVPILAHDGDTRTGERLLAQSQELLGNEGTALGHIYLHKGLLTLDEEQSKTREWWEMAYEHYKKPWFYPKGLATTCRQLSQLSTPQERSRANDRELAYGLVAAVLHPYRENLEKLATTASTTYWRMGSRAFHSCKQDLIEKLWSMNEEPFSVIRQFIEFFDGTGLAQLEMAVQRANTAIHAGLQS